MKFCSNCGSKLAEGADICLKCGKFVNGSKAPGNNPNGRSKMTAGLLGIFLGGWGIHSFYLGFSGKGVTQIIVTIFTCGFGALWGFIEGIMILCGSMNEDVDGNQLNQ